MDFRRGEERYSGLSGKQIMEMTAFHMMEKEVIPFGGEASCHDLAECLLAGGSGSVPIIDGEKIVIGIVSEFDLLDALAKGRDLYRTQVSEIMTQPVVSIQEEMTAEEVIALFQTRHLIRVPVVDSEGRLIGVVARRDIVGCYVESAVPPFYASKKGIVPLEEIVENEEVSPEK